MTRTILLFAIVLILLTACSGDPFGNAAAAQAKAQADIQIAQTQADAQVQTARIDASMAQVRIGGWMVGALIAAVVVVVVAGIAAMTHVQVNRDRLYADAARTLPPVTHATPLPSGRPPSRRPALMRQHTLALPERSERAEDVIVIDA